MHLLMGGTGLYSTKVPHRLSYGLRLAGGKNVIGTAAHMANSSEARCQYRFARSDSWVWTQQIVDSLHQRSHSVGLRKHHVNTNRGGQRPSDVFAEHGEDN